MTHRIFPTPAIEAKHRKGLLGAYFDCFVVWMQRHGYSQHRMRFNIQCLTHFGEYLEQRGIRSIHHLEGSSGKKLLADYHDHLKSYKHWRRDDGLKLFIRSLEEAGVIPSGFSKDLSLFRETQQYLTFLRNQKGLCEGTVQYHLYWTEKFLRFIGYEEKDSSLPTFGIAEIDQFIEQGGTRVNHSVPEHLTGVLRSFLRFLYLSGRVSNDLSSLILSPRRYKFRTLARVLGWGEIRRILDSVDRSTRSGRQHYVILMLLATYGLRAGEVAHLKLKEIDWRKETLRITSGKSGKELWLPLLPEVGKAILDYLKHGRPISKDSHLLLLTRAPWSPLNRHNIASVVRRHIKLSGLNPPRWGPHLFRHSFATHLLRKGVPLKQIGDMLGHRDPDSTHVYTKTAIEQLREVALEIPEVKG